MAFASDKFYISQTKYRVMSSAIEAVKSPALLICHIRVASCTLAKPWLLQWVGQTRSFAGNTPHRSAQCCLYSCSASIA
jgi:hypothetical protein